MAKSREYYENQKLLRERKKQEPKDVKLNEDEVFYLEHHLDVLPRPTLAERLNLSVNQLQYIIKKLKEEKRCQHQPKHYRAG